MGGDTKEDNPNEDVMKLTDNNLRTFDESDLECSLRLATNQTNLQLRSLLSNLSFGECDHFTLKKPSSTVSINNTKYRVFTLKGSQFIVEKKAGETGSVARLAKDTSFGLTMIRVFYALIAALMTGYLFVFCLQIIIFLFLGLAIDGGLTSGAALDIPQLIFGFLSVPVFVKGMASLLAIACSYVIDTYQGSPFINDIRGVVNVSTNWMSFLVYLVTPLCVASITLFLRRDDWWSITVITWLLCVWIAFLIFFIFVMYFELCGCLELARNHPSFWESDEDPDDGTVYTWHTFKRALLIRQRQKHAAYQYQRYTVKDNSNTLRSSSRRSLFNETYQSPLSKIKVSGFFVRVGLYKRSKVPTELFNIGEVREQLLFQTAENWNLEKMYFLSGNTNVVSVLKGNSALRPKQVRSTFRCSLIGHIIPVFLICAFLTWIELNVFVICVVAFLILLCSLKAIRASWRIHQLYHGISDETEESTIHEVQKRFRIASPTDRLCWILLGLEFTFWFLLPMIFLFQANNKILAGIFTVVGVLNLVRTHLNAGNMMMEIGSLDGLEVNNKGANPHEDWLERHRLSWIVSKISHGPRRQIWYKVFLFFIIFFAVAVAGATILGRRESLEEQFLAFQTPLYDFHYPGDRLVKYPSCNLDLAATHQTKHSQAATNVSSSSSVTDETGISEARKLALMLDDYIFFSVVAYLKTNVVQDELNKHFGQGFALVESDSVGEFREEYKNANLGGSLISDVVFHQIYMPTINTTIVTVRGTWTGWDALADVQLWAAAFLTQVVLWVVPFSELWSPVSEIIIQIVSVVQSTAIERVSYYKEVTALVKKLKKEGRNVILTGHSLGGGIAMISGAQTETPTIAVSGPNNVMSRLSFTPQLTLEQIDRFTVNVIPNKDIVPRIDKPGMIIQPIVCNAPAKEFISCHKGERSFCEAQYSCGSRNRPVYCGCAEIFGYEEPIPLGNRTFKEACANNE